MASRITGRVSSSVSRILSRLGLSWSNSSTLSSSSFTRKSCLSEQPATPCEGSRGLCEHGSIGASTYFTSFWNLNPIISRHLLTYPLGGLKVQTAPAVMPVNNFGSAQQARSIMVEVKGNDLDRAIKKWRRKCKEENLRSLKDREYFVKPSQKRVLAAKERDRRNARRLFKMKLNWILSRRQRGF